MPATFEMTSEQRAICDCTDPRLLVEANAGAGKTTTAAMKIARLIEEGANPSKIVALAFSKPGVQAYLEAFRRIGIGQAAAKAIRVGTFEDFCSSRLKRLEGTQVEQLATPEQVRPHVLAAIPRAREWAEARYPGEFGIPGTGDLAVESLLDEFANIKGTMQLLREADHFRLSPAGASELGREFTTLAIYRMYESERCPLASGEAQTKFRYSGDATYDMARALVSEDPPFVWEDHPLKLGIEALVLDEMHDTNWSMFTVLKGLLSVNAGVRFFGIGDRDQVIHAKDGASSNFMGEGFDREIGPPKRLPLSRSYRFGTAIAKPLAAFSRKAYLAQVDGSSKLQVRRTDSAADLLAIVHDAITSRPGLRPGAAISEVAVLLRHPSHATELEHELRRKGILYDAVGFTTYLHRPEILFVRLLLAAAVGLQEQMSAQVLLQAKRATWEFIGGTLRTPADEEDPTSSAVDTASQPIFFKWVLPRLIESTPDVRARDQVLDAIGLASSDRAQDLSTAISALDINRLARRVFVTKQAAEDAEASLRSLADASQHYKSISEFLKALIIHDYEGRAEKLAKQRIVLSSIEAAKGLEFDHVIIPDVNRTTFDGNGDDRNLFYVAASRARQLLTVAHRSGQPSSYLRYFGAG